MLGDFEIFDFLNFSTHFKKKKSIKVAPAIAKLKFYYN